MYIPPNAADLHDYSSFSDESHHDGNNRYMVIGGILCGTAFCDIFSKEFESIRARSGLPDSIQWKTINKRKLRVYEECIDLFFYCHRERAIDFNCIVFDATKVDHDKYSNGDKEKGFFKFLYQHYLKHSRIYPPPARFRCYHGNKDTPYDLRELYSSLNASTRRHPRHMSGRYAEVKLRPVRTTPMLQMADVLIGSVGFYWNRKGDEAGTSAKFLVASKVAREAGLTTLATGTDHPIDEGFSIWPFELR